MALASEVAGAAAGATTCIGGAGVELDDDEVRHFVREQLAGADLEGRSVCVIVPDGTRSGPLPLLLGAVHGALYGVASRLTVLVALGTHAPMDEEAMAAHLGYAPGRLAETYPGTTVSNHEWWDPGALASLGRVSADRVAELSEGRLRQDVEARVNRAVLDHDVALVVGPVFPHEVAGFSGGNKYFFPGVAGPEVIDLSHWLGALITSATIIGMPGVTPVRALIDEASSLIPTAKLAFCTVTSSTPGRLAACAFGPPQASWAEAARVSAQAHVRYLDSPVPRVLSVIPERYQDLWTGAKGFYKVEPVVAEGGEVILYAPHIHELSRMHPEIESIGYHCRDYFVQQWDRFQGLPWGVLAHSTQVRGAGTFDPAEGERCRVTVTLATSIPEEVVRAANLSYRRPEDVDRAAAEADPATLVVPNAGETLFRLR